MSDFSTDHLTEDAKQVMENYVDEIEKIRVRYMENGKNKEDWYDLIQMLPSSYNQTRTVTLNYETLVNIYFARKDHKLDEWHTFCDWVKTLPYAKELILVEV
jgi:ferritin